MSACRRSPRAADPQPRASRAVDRVKASAANSAAQPQRLPIREALVEHDIDQRQRKHARRDMLRQRARRFRWQRATDNSDRTRNGTTAAVSGAIRKILVARIEHEPERDQDRDQRQRDQQKPERPDAAAIERPRIAPARHLRKSRDRALAASEPTATASGARDARARATPASASSRRRRGFRAALSRPPAERRCRQALAIDRDADPAQQRRPSSVASAESARASPRRKPARPSARRRRSAAARADDWRPARPRRI